MGFKAPRIQLYHSCWLLVGKAGAEQRMETIVLRRITKEKHVVKRMENESEVSRVIWEGVGFCIFIADCYEGL